MINLVTAAYNPELEEFSKSLGYTKTLFLEKDWLMISCKDKKKLLLDINIARGKGKLTVCKPSSEEELRFLLEKSNVDMVYGVEGIHEKESLHHTRGGMDQVLCKLASVKGKTLAFSFKELLNAKDKTRLLRRWKFNAKLCRKYKVKTLLATFASCKEEMRSAQDLGALWRVLEKS